MIQISVAEILMLVAGLVLGVIVAYFALPSRREARRLREELDGLKKEHDEYKSGVTEHFVKTAELVGEMTKSYAAVYDHLAGGAQKFCTEVPDTALTFGARPALADSSTVTSTAEPVSETPLREVPLREARTAEASMRPVPPRETPVQAATAREVPVTARGGTGEGPVVAAAAASVVEAETVEPIATAADDDPLHATTGMMAEPGIEAEPGELGDGAPSAPKF